MRSDTLGNILTENQEDQEEGNNQYDDLAVKSREILQEQSPELPPRVKREPSNMVHAKRLVSGRIA